MKERVDEKDGMKLMSSRRERGEVQRPDGIGRTEVELVKVSTSELV